MLEDHVGLDLQIFYKVSPAVKLVLAYFFSSVHLKRIYSDFQLKKKKKKHIALSSHALLHNCVLQLGQVTVVIFVAPATVDFGHSQVT